MRGAVGAVMVVAGLVAGCGGDSAADINTQRCAGADYILPSRTLQDLVTYADQVAVVTLTDDAVVGHDAPDDELEAGSFREVTIRIDDVVWEAPARRPVPDEVTFVPDGGWVDGDPDEGPTAGCDQPVLVEGGRYLVGLVEYSADEWGPMGGPFTLEVDAEGTVHGVVDDGPLAPYEGESAAAVGAALEEVEPDPRVAGFEDLPGGERFPAARAETSTPTEGQAPHAGG
jgi:hypothetical protein